MEPYWWVKCGDIMQEGLSADCWKLLSFMGTAIVVLCGVIAAGAVAMWKDAKKREERLIALLEEERRG